MEGSLCFSHLPLHSAFMVLLLTAPAWGRVPLPQLLPYLGCNMLYFPLDRVFGKQQACIWHVVQMSYGVANLIPLTKEDKKRLPADGLVLHFILHTVDSWQPRANSNHFIMGEMQGFMSSQARIPPNGYFGVLTHLSVNFLFHGSFFPPPQRYCWSQRLAIIVVPLKKKVRVLCKRRFYDPHQVGPTWSLLKGLRKYLTPYLPHSANLNEKGSWV